MKRVLLTGASGFIGQRAIEPLLACGYDVHAVSQVRLGADKEGLFWHCADLLDQQVVQRLVADVRPSHLLHLAWYTAPSKYQMSPENFQWVRASLDLVESFVQEGGRRLVIAGTCAEYDWNYGYCSESLTPLKPSSPYGICKQALAALVESYCSIQGISYAWGRLFFLYGPGEHQDRLVSSVILALLQGKDAHCTHGQQLRDFLYVDDVASAFVSLLESRSEGPVNIGSGRPVALSEIVHAIADNLDCHHRIVLGALSAPLNDPALLVANCTRLMEEVGWRPMYDLSKGIGLTVNYWKDYIVNRGKV